MGSMVFFNDFLLFLDQIFIYLMTSLLLEMILLALLHFSSLFKISNLLLTGKTTFLGSMFLSYYLIESTNKSMKDDELM